MESFIQGFLDFSDNSPTPFHACKNSATILLDSGFKQLSETAEWNGTVVKGGKYFFTRNGSTLCAFIVGSNYKSGNGFKIIGAHSDSPVLKVKPVSKREAYGIEQVGVETYGGGLWHTWFDRDLGVAGRVIVKDPTTDVFKQQLVHIKKPILRVATLCKHLRTAEEYATFSFNTETELLPLLSNLSEELNSSTGSDLDPRHSAKLLTLLGTALNCDPQTIMDFDLCLTDTQGAVLGGAAKEFIFAPRLDNQVHSYLGTKAISALASSLDPNESNVLMFCMFDHEEVGSVSSVGAAGPLVRDAVGRLLNLFYAQEAPKHSADELFKIGLAKSIHMSADVEHAVHPNYPNRHESNHQIKLGLGTALMVAGNQTVATNMSTGFIIRQLAKQNKVGYFDPSTAATTTGFAEIPIQEIVGRNGGSSGSTLGPILASGAGIRTVDVGVPELSMHSIREQVAAKDMWSTYHLFLAFFKYANSVDQSVFRASEF